ncbi:MAG: calcium-binding protein [Cyanobacteria bacterium CRU_2_1]|nr:calcium-binding protein [Cyanobacteria bacterium CRU_2_1]
MTTIPDFNTATFVPGDPIDNPYHPLTPGTISVYEGEPEDEEMGEEIEETIRFAVTFQTEDIAGVTATVVRETAWANGFLQEDTDDWFAQDTDGNVWYLGESTTAFEYDDDGNFIGTNNDGAWEAGVNGALPGYIMKANPQVGDRYYQEFAPNDEALDQAEVISRSKTLATEVGTVRNVLQTLESTELAPGVFDFKYYAPGIGLVLVEELDENLEPDFIVELESITSVTADFFTSGRGTQGNDGLDGDNTHNTIEGRRGDDLLQGFGGNDRLLGQDGNDFLVGGDGVDVLMGGKGQDILIGGEGADILKGGEDRDQFVFRTLADKSDRIKDFTGQDVIILVEIFDSANYGSSTPLDDYLQITQMGSHTVIRIDVDGDSGSNPFEVLATLKNTNANILSDANFVV